MFKKSEIYKSYRNLFYISFYKICKDSFKGFFEILLKVRDSVHETYNTNIWMAVILWSSLVHGYNFSMFEKNIIAS